jgi:hypothetical protein
MILHKIHIRIDQALITDQFLYFLKVTLISKLLIFFVQVAIANQDGDD